MSSFLERKRRDQKIQIDILKTEELVPVYTDRRTDGQRDRETDTTKSTQFVMLFIYINI